MVVGSGLDVYAIGLSCATLGAHHTEVPRYDPSGSFFPRYGALVAVGDWTGAAERCPSRWSPAQATPPTTRATAATPPTADAARRRRCRPPASQAWSPASGIAASATDSRSRSRRVSVIGDPPEGARPAPVRLRGGGGGRD